MQRFEDIPCGYSVLDLQPGDQSSKGASARAFVQAAASAADCLAKFVAKSLANCLAIYLANYLANCLATSEASVCLRAGILLFGGGVGEDGPRARVPDLCAVVRSSGLHEPQGAGEVIFRSPAEGPVPSCGCSRLHLTAPCCMDKATSTQGGCPCLPFVFGPQIVWYPPSFTSALFFLQLEGEALRSSFMEGLAECHQNNAGKHWKKRHVST